jgi:hypothetical protein
LLLGACARSPDSQRASVAGEPITVSERDSAGVRIVSIAGSISTLPEWTLSATPLTEIRSDADPFIGSVGEVAFVGDRGLLVSDNQTAELRSFDGDGHVVRTLGKKGDGPGEFRRIAQVSVVEGDTVYVFDYPLFRISVFDPNGALVRTIPVPDAFAGPGSMVLKAKALGSDRLLVFGNRMDPREAGDPRGPVRRGVRDGIVAILATDTEQLAPPIQFPGGLHLSGNGYSVASPFANRPFATVNADRVLFGSGSTYELAVRDLDLRPVILIRWSGWGRPLTPSVAEGLRSPLEESLDSLRSKVPPGVDRANRRMLDDWLEPELMPDSLPALGGAMLDEHGRIWVARFDLARDFISAMTGFQQWQQEDVWHVLDAEGHPLARVRLPPESRLLAVRADRVALVTRNSLGAESVRVLAIDTVAVGRNSRAGVPTSP